MPKRPTYKDLHDMLLFGRRLAIHDDKVALDSAAEYIVIAGPDERRFLRSEFHEGVRNAAKNEWHSQQCMALLDLRVNILETALVTS